MLGISVSIYCNGQIEVNPGYKWDIPLYPLCSQVQNTAESLEQVVFSLSRSKRLPIWLSDWLAAWSEPIRSLNVINELIAVT